MKKKEKEIIIIVIIILVIFVGICFYIYFVIGIRAITTECSIDSDCSWTITNCCSESSGAHWECINPEKSLIICGKGILCFLMPSPKPETSCSCADNQCQGAK